MHHLFDKKKKMLKFGCPKFHLFHLVSFFWLGNVTNRLALLSNTQFVESRVADDDDLDVHADGKDVEEKNIDTNPEETFCRKVGEALSAGADFVDSNFETIKVGHFSSQQHCVISLRLPNIFGGQTGLAFNYIIIPITCKNIKLITNCYEKIPAPFTLVGFEPKSSA